LGIWRATLKVPPANENLVERWQQTPFADRIESRGSPSVFVEEWPAISRRLDEALSLVPAEREPWLDALAEPDSVKAKLPAATTTPASSSR
jgi:hypothetical protein